MGINELYLKTVFCCIACDGDVATEEIEQVKKITSESDLYNEMNVEDTLNKWIEQINNEGNLFLLNYLNELSTAKMTREQELQVVDLAIDAIEADNIIQYSEIKFFKKIRSQLVLSDDAILAMHPDKEDWLLPDIKSDNDILQNVRFAEIHFKKNRKHHKSMYIIA